MKILILPFIIFFSLQAFSLELITGKVTVLEPTYLPNTITFQLDKGNVTCPAGHWLKWEKPVDNNRAVYSTLMAALVSGKKVHFYINDKDNSCTGKYLHLINS